MKTGLEGIDGRAVGVLLGKKEVDNFIDCLTLTVESKIEATVVRKTCIGFIDYVCSSED